MDNTPSTPQPIIQVPQQQVIQNGSKKRGWKISILLVFLGVLMLSCVIFMQYLLRQNKALQQDFDKKISKLQKSVTKLEKPAKYIDEQVEGNNFQAVFLSGGQVYFGHITQIDDNTITLVHIFYLRTGTYNKDGTVSGDTTLIKLGDELHSPKDVMYIERKNTLFWENLKPDGKVPQAIKQYEKLNPNKAM